jgi:hypothetical protein
MTGTRDLQTFRLYGQRKHVGSVDAPIFANNGVLFLIAGVGQDGLPGYGVTGTVGGGVTTTLNGTTAPGATTITVTSAAGIVANTTIIQIDVNSPTTPTTSECRLVTAIATDTLTLDAPLVYAHLTTVAVISVVSPFTHTAIPNANYLPSLTVEKNLGGAVSLGGESIQYSGCRVGKIDIKGSATDTEAAFTTDVTAQWAQILDTPSSVTFVDENPFAFSTFDLEYNGVQYSNPTNFSLTLDNGLKPTYTMNGSQDLQFNPAVALHASGQFTNVYDSLDDSTYGFWNKMYTETEASLSFTMTNAAGFSVAFNMPYVDLKMDAIDPKASDVITEVISYEVRRSLSLSAFTLSMVVVNSYHLAY